MKTYSRIEWAQYCKENNFTKIFRRIMDERPKLHPEMLSSQEHEIESKSFIRVLVDGKTIPIFMEIATFCSLDENDPSVLSEIELDSVTIFDDQGQYDLYRDMARKNQNTQSLPQLN